MAYTVKDELLEIAENHGWTFEETADEQLSAMIEPSVPERFRRLVLEVMLRLPGSWDYSTQIGEWRQMGNKTHRIATRSWIGLKSEIWGITSS